MSTDGAANERLGASQLVGEGNDHHCDAHHIQLVLNDVCGQESKIVACKAHRDVLRKSHSLVILINGHKKIYSEFSNLARVKRAAGDGARKFEALIINNDTRWDSELAMLERLVAFDSEILELYRKPDLQISPDCILSRYEFDLAYAMTLVLIPFRRFTKFVQQREAVTLAHVPRLIDELVTSLAANSFNASLVGCADGVVAAMNTFQAALVDSIKARYSPMFNSASLARTASFFLPGRRYRDFVNFPNADEDRIVQDVRIRIATDAAALTPGRQNVRDRLLRSLEDIRADLDDLDADMEPLSWFPLECETRSIFPIAMLYLSIPSTSAEDERNFSSAGVTLDKLRSRLDIDNFRYEHRVRRYLTAGSEAQSQEGRQLRQLRAETLLNIFSERYPAAAAPGPAPQAPPG